MHSQHVNRTRKHEKVYKKPEYSEKPTKRLALTSCTPKLGQATLFSATCLYMNTQSNYRDVMICVEPVDRVS